MRTCAIQNLKGTSVYGRHNLSFPPPLFPHTHGWNRVKVAAKSWWAQVPMSPCPQARLQWMCMTTHEVLKNDTDVNFWKVPLRDVNAKMSKLV